VRRARPPVASGWGARWATLVEPARGASDRHARASSARVRDLEIGTGGVTARIRDARGHAAEPAFALDPFPKDVREKAIDALARKASFAASLLAGRLPEDVDDVLAAATGRTLLPARAGEIRQSCTCGEPLPCRHLLALHEVVEERLSGDPFLLFTLRGIDEKTLLGELRRRRAAGKAESPRGAPPRPRAASEARATPLPDVPPERFYRPIAPFVSAAAPYAAATPADAVLASLGPPPLDDADAARLLAELHRAIGLGAKERLSEWEWRRS